MVKSNREEAASLGGPESRIRVLPPDIVNRIAAGEVVERPASVLKELVENAIDADSTEVTVVLEEGGKKRILVRDNGRGMTPEDLPLAFHSHATSKLRDEDLFSNALGVSSLGFRGEALASIGSIGMVEVVSRTPRAEHASRYRPGAAGPEPAAGEPGTAVEVLDLFYNVPARRKFLRTGSTELSHCVQQFLRVAMANPGVHMRLLHGKRTVLDLRPSDQVGERLRQIVPRKISDDLLEVCEGDDPDLPRVEGFIGAPRLHRRDTKEQHFFVNGRWVRDRTLSHALRSAYQGFHIPGYQPIAYLFIDCPRGDVDANVHPTKTEVRFRDSSALYRLVHHAVRGALESTTPRRDHEVGGVAASVSGDSEEAPPGYTTRDFFSEISGSKQHRAPTFERPRERRSGGGPGASTGGRSIPRVDVEREATTEPDPVDSDHSMRSDGFSAPAVAVPEADVAETSDASEDAGPSRGSVKSNRTVEKSSTATESFDSSGVLQLMNSYLVVDLSDRMLLIDQHALHEIILFEEIYARLADGVLESQRLLVPEVVRLPVEYVPLVDRAATLLQRFGFEMEAFGPDSVALHALPSIFDREAGRTDLPAMVFSVLESLQDGFVKTSATRLAREREMPLGIDAQLRDIGATIACKRAVKAGMPLADEEMRSLLNRARTAFDPRHCPHGRPTVVSYSKQEIEKMFDRR